jgi:hypothetical protein
MAQKMEKKMRAVKRLSDFQPNMKNGEMTCSSYSAFKSSSGCLALAQRAAHFRG